ncbi:MAG: nucleotidyl transferase AbiEii/AbiGii toxin family protein [Terriglobales bacterium]
MEQTSKAWHLEVLSPEVADTARRLARIEALRNFYLAGGTALALHLGHRRSVDLDLFTAQVFNEDQLIAALKGFPGLSVLSKSPQTVYLHISGTKVSFIGYDYPVLFAFEPFQGLSVADVRDIACMKLSALAGRGSRRDFVDLYVVAQRYGLSHLLDLFQKKFAQANYSSIHLKKALTYFADAEVEAMPDMLAPFSWDELKTFFVREVPNLRSS